MLNAMKGSMANEAARVCGLPANLEERAIGISDWEAASAQDRALRPDYSHHSGDCRH
jgi:hypothetical protein